MTMSQRKIVSETTLKMILMSQSWGWDPTAPSLVPGQLASRSKQVGDLDYQKGPAEQHHYIIRKETTIVQQAPKGQHHHL